LDIGHHCTIIRRSFDVVGEHLHLDWIDRSRQYRKRNLCICLLWTPLQMSTALIVIPAVQARPFKWVTTIADTAEPTLSAMPSFRETSMEGASASSSISGNANATLDADESGGKGQ
jgi:hypothetical protein